MAISTNDQVYITNSTVPIDGAIQEVVDGVATKQTAIQVQDAGVNVGIAGYGETLNFTGAGVTVTDMGSHLLQIAITGGGGGSPASGGFVLDDGTSVASGVFLMDDGSSV